MNGREMLLAFADLDGAQIAKACDIEKARQSFRAYEKRRKKTLGATICCFVAASAAVGVGYRGMMRKLPTVPPSETSGVRRSNSDSAAQDPTTAAVSVAIASSFDTTLPGPEATKPLTTAPDRDPPATEPPNSTVSDVISETSEGRNTSEQTENAEAPTTEPPSATEPPTRPLPTTAPPNAEQPAPSSDSPELVVFEKYVYRVDVPEYASYLPGKVLEDEKVGAKIMDATATAGWIYADGSTSVTEDLRCELFEIAGVERAVAICVKFIDKGEALTTDHYYVLYDPSADPIRISDQIIPTTVPNHEE